MLIGEYVRRRSHKYTITHIHTDLVRASPVISQMLSSDDTRTPHRTPHTAHIARYMLCQDCTWHAEALVPPARLQARHAQRHKQPCTHARAHTHAHTHTEHAHCTHTAHHLSTGTDFSSETRPSCGHAADRCRHTHTHADTQTRALSSPHVSFMDEFQVPYQVHTQPYTHTHTTLHTPAHRWF